MASKSKRASSKLDRAYDTLKVPVAIASLLGAVYGLYNCSIQSQTHSDQVADRAKQAVRDDFDAQADQWGQTIVSSLSIGHSNTYSVSRDEAKFADWNVRQGRLEWVTPSPRGHRFVALPGTTDRSAP